MVWSPGSGTGGWRGSPRWCSRNVRFTQIIFTVYCYISNPVFIPAVVSDVTFVSDKKPQPGLNYGRIKRAPRIPLKKGKSSDSSSSSSDNGEDSSCGEEDAGDNDDVMVGEDSAEEDKKEVCIQVKLGKEEKSKPPLDK